MRYLDYREIHLSHFCHFFRNRSMDRTLIESQQLDFLFEQMLASRRQQDGTGAAAPPPAVLSTAEYNTGNDGGVGDGECLIQSPQLEYADVSADFCVEADQMWTGKTNGCFYLQKYDCYVS